MNSEFIDKQIIDNLLDFHQETNLTVFTPTHRFHEKKPDRRDFLAFKNNISQAKEMLMRKGYEEKKADKFLKPGYQLLENDEYWSYQSDGLALFISENWSAHYRLPIPMENQVYISDHFYVKPLIEEMSSKNRFFLLVLSQNEVKFFECTPYSITPVRIHDLVPASIKESLPEKEMAFSGAISAGGFGHLHYGHQAGKDQVDIEHFFRQIDNGLMEMLYDEDAPMVLACVDYLRPIYEKVNRYQHLIESENVSGNPENEDVSLLKEKAWRIVKPSLDSKKREAKNTFLENKYNDRTSTDIKTILQAAHEGKVASLLLRREGNIWGEYHYPDQIIRHISRQAESTCLLNVALLKTLKNGGETFLYNRAAMPAEKSDIAAIFRY